MSYEPDPMYTQVEHITVNDKTYMRDLRGRWWQKYPWANKPNRMLDMRGKKVKTLDRLVIFKKEHTR